MRILYFVPHPTLYLKAPTGYGTHIREMVEALKGQGHEVEVLMMGGTDGPTSPEALPGRSREPARPSRLKRTLKALLPSLAWQTARDAILWRHDLRAAAALDAAIRRFQPELIYERGNYLQDAGAAVAARAGVPRILELNAPFVEERIDFAGKSLFLARARRAERAMATSARLVVVVSSALRERLLTDHPLDPERVLVCPNAIRPEGFKTDAQEIERLRRELGLEGRRVLGFVGSGLPWHGLNLLLSSVAALSCEKRAGLALLLVGGGKHERALREEAERLRLSSSVVLTGDIDHASVPNHLALMDISVMPNSNWYGSPVKIFEYGVLGLPIIAPSLSPLRDVMEDGVHGLLVPPGPAALTAAIARLLDDEELAQRLAACFREKVLAEHTWQQVARRIMDRYEALDAL